VANFEKLCWRPERGEVTGAGDTVAKASAMDGLATRVHCNVLNLPGTWRTICKRPTPAKIIPAGRRPSGYGEFKSDRVRANPGAKIFYSPQLSTLCWARIAVAGVNPGARSPAARCNVPKIFFSYCTIESVFNVLDRASLSAIYSKLCVTT
jgi:hypothetical protein